MDSPWNHRQAGHSLRRARGGVAVAALLALVATLAFLGLVVATAAGPAAIAPAARAHETAQPTATVAATQPPEMARPLAGLRRRSRARYRRIPVFQRRVSGRLAGCNELLQQSVQHPFIRSG